MQSDMLASMNDSVQKLPKLSREKWLQMAIDALATECKSKFSLDSLLEAMPVTKGSFYSHFSSRTDFLLALVNYWDRTDTQGVIKALENLPKGVSAEEKLWELTQAIFDLNLNQYEQLIRTLSFEFPQTCDAIERVDCRRIATLVGLFKEMGFDADEAKMRARVYVTAISQEASLLCRLSEEENLKYHRALHRFFTQH